MKTKKTYIENMINKEIRKKIARLKNNFIFNKNNKEFNLLNILGINQHSLNNLENKNIDLNLLVNTLRIYAYLNIEERNKSSIVINNSNELLKITVEILE